MPRPTRKASANVVYSEQPAAKRKAMGSGASTAAAKSSATNKKAKLGGMERGDSAADFGLFKSEYLFCASPTASHSHSHSLSLFPTAHSFVHTPIPPKHTRTHRATFHPRGCAFDVSVRPRLSGGSGWMSAGCGALNTPPDNSYELYGENVSLV